MEYPKYLIYLKSSRTQKFEYKQDVKEISQNGKLYSVTFSNGKEYNYSYDKVKLYEFKSVVNNVKVYIDNRLREDVDTFLDYGEMCLLAGDNFLSNPMLNSSRIECVKITSIEGRKSVIEYFREIVNNSITSLDTNTETEEEHKQKNNNSEIIFNALNNIDLADTRTALSSYLDGVYPKECSYSKTTIFPFGCNESQKLAVERAMSSNMSIIEGPPGTGKTQTILNIAANIIFNNKSVAIVSNNNSAVDNIRKKLSDRGYGAVIAALGNKNNCDDFFNNIKKIDDFKEHQLSNEELSKIEFKVASLSNELEESFAKRSKVARLKLQLIQAKREQEHLNKEHPLEAEEYNSIKGKFLRKESKRRALLLRYLLLNSKRSLVTMFLLIFKLGYYDFLNYNANLLLKYANHCFYKQRIYEISREIDELESWLENVNDKLMLKDLVDLSSKLFSAKLALKYGAMENYEFNNRNYKRNFNDFINRYPIITSTTLSLNKSLSKNQILDYLIIDEASQVDILKASICFACARQIIVVGDSCQLNHIVDKESKVVANNLLSRMNISPSYNYVNNSILDSLKALYGSSIPTTLLKEHYRCHPLIIDFCNKRYYNGELVIMTNLEDYNLPPFKIIETNISGYKNKYNQRQIDETERYIIDNYSDDYKQVGVVSPYRNHADLLKAQLPKDCEADTIHKYQGREKKFIIFNTVAGEINNFIDHPNLINVAVSRAEKGLVIIKPKSMNLPHGSNIGDLIRHICYNYDAETVIKEGVISSVFDILYKEYNNAYCNYLALNKDVDGSPAEVIIHNLLEEILNEPQFTSIEFRREYYLEDLIKDNNKDESIFTADETLYISNHARLDFLLYNKLDNCPIIAIEVDGVTFHNDEVQNKRDNLKNSILEKVKLPLLRLRTNGHNEKERIIENLMRAMDVNI